ncbi:MAG: methylmalonyl Co-A mutase-associated GTPase MeaB [Pseudomonadota bacterium]
MAENAASGSGSALGPVSGPLETLKAGGKRALANALARVEAASRDPATAALLDAAFAAPQGIALGLTGPPGVGKSTLIDALIRAWRATGRTVGVIAVDPSSSRSGGALLGDRTRLTVDPADTGIFVRSMAARDRLGGVAEITYPAVVLMRALYDLVIVETVGVGQSETAIAEVSDLTAVCVQPGSGDTLQFMKAGVMEIPDMVVVTKADLGALATRTIADLRGALSLTGERPILGVSATSGEGVDAFVHEICVQTATFLPHSNQIRYDQARQWALGQISVRFGQFGLQLVHRHIVDNRDISPFGTLSRWNSHLEATMTEAFRPLP